MAAGHHWIGRTSPVQSWRTATDQPTRESLVVNDGFALRITPRSTGTIQSYDATHSHLGQPEREAGSSKSAEPQKLRHAGSFVLTRVGGKGKNNARHLVLHVKRQEGLQSSTFVLLQRAFT